MKPIAMQTVEETEAALLASLAKHHGESPYGVILYKRALAVLQKRPAILVPVPETSPLGVNLSQVVSAAEAMLATKRIEVWRVEYAALSRGKWRCVVDNFVGPEGEENAHDRADYLSGESGNACISVTGPHQQEIPA